MKPIQTYTKCRHISFIYGPILFTAPHSKRLIRGGPKYKQQQRIHQRQLYTAWIASELSNLMQKNMGSFVVWGKSAVLDEKQYDPNYLLDDMLADSCFHQSLHYWANKMGDRPLLHVDIHGKMNRKNNCEVDIGKLSMQVHWKDDLLASKFRPFFEEKLSKIFEGLNFREFTCRFNTVPSLHGYWGGGLMTMTEQAIKLGIPSFQVEIPMQVRKELFKKPQLMKAFSNGILEFYYLEIVPHFSSKKIPRRIDEKIGKKFESSVKQVAQVNGAINQIRKMQQKYALQLNSKQI